MCDELNLGKFFNKILWKRKSSLWSNRDKERES